MTVAEILAPVFVQVALTFVLLFWMATIRTASVRNRETRVKDVVLGQPNWPPYVTKVSNSYHNQLQLPVLFYVLVPLAMFTRKADLVFVIMSWVFVLTRIIHAAIHTTSNNITQRFAVFALGALVLLLVWAIFAIRILLNLP
jgi:hypothetical protein